MEDASLLLIEDHAQLRDVFTLLLSAYGYHVTAMADGESALQYLTNTSTLPALVLTDYRLPVLTGAAVTRAIRADARTADIPVIMMSSDPSVMYEAHASKASAFFNKAIDIDILQACIEYLLEIGHHTIVNSSMFAV